MKLWLDDIRSAPDDFIWIKSVREAINIYATIRETGNFVHEISLDHDLGDFTFDGGDVIKFVDWLCEVGWWPIQRITIHSGNPVGRDNMMRAIKRFGPYNKFTYNSASFEEQ